MKSKEKKQKAIVERDNINQLLMQQSKTNGITLIALVVTIVLLLILAGITISTVFSENGLIQKAQQAKDAQLIAMYQDRIEIVCLDWSLDKSLNDEIGIDDLWVKMKDAGIILDIERDVEKLDDEGNYVITVPEGYKFQIHINENGDAEVEYIGKEDALLPYIQSVEVIGKTTNSVTVEVTVTREGENLTLSYYYKKLNDPEGNYVAIKENVEEKTVEVTGLESETIYQLKVIAKNENGENEKTVELTVEGIIGAGEGLKEGAIIASEPTWDSSSHTASITLSKGADVASNLSIEWQKGSITGAWTTGTNVTGLNHNDIVYARLTDGTNHGQEASVTIKDEIAPNAPTISIASGTTGNNGYYKSNVTVTITAGSDGQSGANQVRYSVSGAQTLAETTTAAGTTTASITITAEGTSTITAYTLDKAGNVSTASTQTINKDSTAPSTASITVGTVAETSIAVTARGADATSGIYSYQFQRSTTSATSGFTTVATQTSSATSYSYTYTGLTEGTTYYLRVIVTDRAGNTRTGTAVKQETTSKTVANILKEGDWVNYVDKNGDTRKCIVLYDNSSGYGVQIITEDTVETVTLGDDDNFTTAMNSYNNAISTLNTRAMAYLNTTYASDARSIGSVPNNKNSQSGYFTSSYSHMTNYNGKLRDEDDNYETDYNQMGALGIRTSDRTYWLASRRVNSASTSSYSTSSFCVRCVYSSGDLNSNGLCSVLSNGTYCYNWTYGLRPCFTLKSGIKVTGGDGTESSPYELGT